MKKSKIFVFVWASIFSIISFAQQPDLLHGDNLDFTYGTSGWKGAAGSYNNSTASSPNWSQSNTYTEITTAKDGCNSNLFTIITDTNATDPHTNNALRKVPTHLGVTKSLQVNNDAPQCLPNYSQASYDMMVDDDNCLLSIYYAIVLEAPGHSGYINPTFQIDVIRTSDNQQISDCSFWEMQGVTPIPAGSIFLQGQSSGYSDSWIYCPWQQVKINLANYIGESITIRVRIGDCGYNFHAGYGYICAKAEKPTIEVAGCSGEGNVITEAIAPDGFDSYKWFRVTRTSVSQSSLENLEPADNSLEVLGTNRILQVTEDMMQGQTTQYFAVKLISPRTQTTRPNCVAYIKATVNDIRPNFDDITYEPVNPLSEEDEVGFEFTQVRQRTEDSPMSFQSLDFGDGHSIEFEKNLENNIWSVSSTTPQNDNSTRVTLNANQSIDTVYHTYSPGNYVATRYATSYYVVEGDEGNDTIYCTRHDTIHIAVAERPSILLQATDTICIGASDTIFASSPDNAPEVVANYKYYWWYNIEDTVSEAINVGNSFILNDVNENTSVVVKVLDEVNGFYRFGYFTVYVQEFPDISLEGDTMLCMGQMANITASDQTGNTQAMQWSFVNPGDNPRITDPSTNPVLSFYPTKDTVVYLICETSAGCISHKGINIIMTDPKVSSDKINVCPNEEVTLIGSNAVDYSWTSQPQDISLTENVRSTEPVVVTPQDTTTYTMRGYGSSGCYTERQITINVIPVPTPLISYTPQYVDTEDPTVSFTDASTYGAYSLWKFSDGGSSNNRTIRYHFNDLSEDSVTIYLKSANILGFEELSNNEYNCSADTSITIPIELFSVWVPNAFSPNGDGVNDYFFFMSSNLLTDISFEVYNRWGTKLFDFKENSIRLTDLNDTNIGWDGKYKGEYVQEGVYVWKLEYKREGNTRVYQKTGTVTVVR